MLRRRAPCLRRITRSTLTSTTSRAVSRPSYPVRCLTSTACSMAEHLSFAKDNFSISGASGLYDRARPSYPPAAISQLLSSLPQGAVVVELGSGTGLFTRGFLQAAAAEGSEGKVKSLLAVEPSEGMRAAFEMGLEGLRDAQGRVGGVEVVCTEGTFDKVPVESGSVDLVVIAQAFHWTGTSGGPAVEEIARILKPGGTWAKIWNLEDPETAWVRGIRGVYEEFEAGTPQYRLGLWKHIWDLPSFSRLFSSPEEHTTFRRALPTNEDLVVDRVFSKSYITALSDEEKKGVEEKVREVVRQGEGKKWIKEEEGTFEYPYKTDLFVTRRL
ncbi:hypothetical protein JCM10213_007056 [Rhodosporidiobolus nylandii]